MTNKFVDVVRFVPVSGGTGDFVVSAAVQGYRTPAAAGATNGATYSYRAESSDLSEWEIGTATYTSGTTTLARTTVLASSTGSKVNFTTPPQVAITLLSGDIVDAATLTAGTLADARLSSNVPLLNSANSFTANLTVAGADLKSYRAGGTTGVVYLDSAGSKYLYNNGSRYALPAQGLDVGGDVVATNTAKAWVKWGTSTTILGSYGVSSISLAGTAWTVNFSTAFSNANYAATATLQATGGTANVSCLGAQTTSSIIAYEINPSSGTGMNTASKHLHAHGT